MPRRSSPSGPDVSLEPRTAQTLALALHELSTNAAKYGALSVPSGRVHLTWELQPQNLVLRWIESGGPAVAPAAISRLRHQGDQRQRRAPARGRGEVRLASRRAALQPARCRAATISSRWLRHAGRIASLGEDKSTLPMKLETGNRILLVEDEILVAMMMRDILTELGFSVVGPFSRLSRGDGRGRAR